MSTATMPRAIHGRPRGFIDWNPQAKTVALLAQVRGILAEYWQFLPLTIRQIFYRLVGVHGYDKTEVAYDRLGETLNRARRAQMISFDAIRDDGFHRTGFCGWNDIEQAQASFLQAAEDYRLDRQTDQLSRIVIWCEAQGMVPQLERVAEPYSVPVFSSGGFDSLTVKYQAASEFARSARVTVLHIGDHDPSGVHVFGSLDEDVGAFVEAQGGQTNFVRLAVTPEHIDEYRLPTAPAKATDRRAFVGATVQAEALPPNTLAEIVRDAITERIDGEIYRHTVERESEQRAALVAWLQRGPR